MGLIPARTQLEADLEVVDRGLLDSAEALNHAAAVLKRSHASFWALPPDRLLAVLNHDLSRTAAIFAANLATATALNAQLDELGLERYSQRAPTGYGLEGISFDQGQGLWIYTPPAEPEPEA